LWQRFRNKSVEPKHVRTRGTDNKLVSDERNVRIQRPNFGYTV